MNDRYNVQTIASNAIVNLFEFLFLQIQWFTQMYQMLFNMVNRSSHFNIAHSL